MKNKKILLLILLLLIMTSLFANNNQAVATVNLIKNEVIKRGDLDNALLQYGATKENELEVLNILINDAVFIQGAERDGITVNDYELEALYKGQKTNIENSQGISLTDAQFEQLIVQNYGDVEFYKETLKNQYILQAYLQQEKGDELKNADVMPTETDINNFYKKNQTSFVQAENVKFAHIYISKTENNQTNKINKEMLEGVYADIIKGDITFEAAVAKYTEDEESKSSGGVVGWLASDNTVVRQGWGDLFVDTTLALPVGKISPVIESLTGYHIVKTIVHNDARILNLQDRIDPEQGYTVYNYIKEGLISQNTQIVMAELINEMVAELRKEAMIRILLK